MVFIIENPYENRFDARMDAFIEYLRNKDPEYLDSLLLFSQNDAIDNAFREFRMLIAKYNQIVNGGEKDLAKYQRKKERFVKELTMLYKDESNDAIKDILSSMIEDLDRGFAEIKRINEEEIKSMEDNLEMIKNEATDLINEYTFGG